MNKMKSFPLLLTAIVTLSALTSATKVYAGESEDNRGDKTVMLTAQLAGYGPSAASTMGLNLGYYVNPNAVILIEGMKNMYSDDLGQPEFNNIKFDSRDSSKGQSYGVHMKLFLGNSFYVRGGVDHREFSYRYNDAANGNSSGFDSTSLALSGAIGNQWQWTNFTMGCDWIGIVRPISTTFTNEYVTGASQATAQSKFREQRDLVRGREPILLRFYVGASF